MFSYIAHLIFVVSVTFVLVDRSHLLCFRTKESPLWRTLHFQTAFVQFLLLQPLASAKWPSISKNLEKTSSRLPKTKIAAAQTADLWPAMTACAIHCRRNRRLTSTKNTVNRCKGRLIGENIRLIDSIIQCAEEQNNPRRLLFLDFEKAIDSLEWSLIWLLEHVWVRVLCNKTESCIWNNGWSFFFFSLKEVLGKAARHHYIYLRVCSFELQ